MAMTAGKLWRMRRLADDAGRMTMLAVDQRPPIERLVADARGERTARREDVSAVKTLLLEALADEVSAVLVDPLIAYPDGWRHLDPSRGLLVTLEHAVYDEGPGGRRSGPIPGWSVEAISRMGGDAVKVLAWYRPDADPAVREHQEEWVAEVGDACHRHDLPFVFELLVYPFATGTGVGDSYAEDAGKRAEAVIESVETFADPTYGVDLFKLESPIPAVDLPDPGDDDGTAAGWFEAMDRAAGRPWVVLSAGASPEAFRRVLAHALDAGASGFLAGRAIWWDAVSSFPDLGACRATLERDAVPYLRSLVDDAARARPWFDALDDPTLDDGDEGFAGRYGQAP